MNVKIFLINLDRRPDRLQYVQHQMERLNLDFTRISAVDGQFLSMETQSLINIEQFIIETKKKPVLGELGCALSHRKVWEKIIDENIEYALILEDDVKIKAELLTFLHNFKFYNFFDFLNLSTNKPYNIDVDVLHRLKQLGMFERKRIDPNLNVWKKLEWRNKWKIFKLHYNSGLVALECDPAPALGSGYIISNKAAQSFLNSSEKLNFPIDWIWRYAGGELRQGFLAQPLIIQDLKDTDIKGREDFLSLNLVQRFKRQFSRVSRKNRLMDIKKLYPDA